MQVIDCVKLHYLLSHIMVYRELTFSSVCICDNDEVCVIITSGKNWMFSTSFYWWNIGHAVGVRMCADVTIELHHLCAITIIIMCQPAWIHILRFNGLRSVRTVIILLNRRCALGKIQHINMLPLQAGYVMRNFRCRQVISRVWKGYSHQDVLNNLPY